ncbi:hypothetical protein PTKIN_Ptkin12aG0096800 [Pterospermum kingtungense]
MTASIGCGNANSNRGNGEERRHAIFDELILRNMLNALLVDGENFCRIVEKGNLEAYGVETQAVDNGRLRLTSLPLGLSLTSLSLTTIFLSSMALRLRGRFVAWACVARFWAFLLVPPIERGRHFWHLKLMCSLRNLVS